MKTQGWVFLNDDFSFVKKKHGNWASAYRVIWCLDMFNELTTVDMDNISSFLNEVYVRKSSGEKLVIPSTNFVFRFAFNFFSWKNLIKMILRPYYPGICIDIDISKHVVNTSIRSITFLFGNLSNTGRLGVEKAILFQLGFANPFCTVHECKQYCYTYTPIYAGANLLIMDKVTTKGLYGGAEFCLWGKW